MYSASSLVCVISFSSFNRSPGTYVVNEGSGSAQPVLSLSYSSSINITIQVSTTNGSATGEYLLDHLVNHCKKFIDGIPMLQEEVLIIILDHTMSHFLLE